MNLPRRNFLHLVASTAAVVGAPRLALAQSYPSRPVRIIVGNVAGGTQDVIARMLMYNLPRIDYQRYDYWIGTYKNDPDTRREVEKVCSVYPHVRQAVTENDGPTSKADCMNAVLTAIAEHDARAGIRYDLIVFHDVEDLIHPQELPLLNWIATDSGGEYKYCP